MFCVLSVLFVQYIQLTYINIKSQLILPPLWATLMITCVILYFVSFYNLCHFIFCVILYFVRVVGPVHLEYIYINKVGWYYLHCGYLMVLHREHSSIVFSLVKKHQQCRFCANVISQLKGLQRGAELSKLDMHAGKLQILEEQVQGINGKVWNVWIELEQITNPWEIVSVQK